MITSEILNRKGAVKGNLIPQSILNLLNRGEIETVNLIEWSAVDHRALVQEVFPSLDLKEVIPDLITLLENIEKPSAMKNVQVVGGFLYDYGLSNQNLDSIYKQFVTHKSDTIRCYACYLIALRQDINVVERLEISKDLIADANFGVREIIWMALRPQIVIELDEVLLYLLKWTTDPEERIRRFITEVTRPKGVWTQTIISLKNNPEKALPLLEALRNDVSLYVQNSVGNWLNDASKSQPEFVRDICSRWLRESDTKATKYIVQRAMRTLNK